MHPIDPHSSEALQARPTAAVPSGKGGMWASIACTVHCLALPVLAIAAPSLARQMEALAWAEYLFACLAVGLVIMQLLPDSRLHGRMAPLRLAIAGLAAMCLGLILPELSLTLPSTELAHTALLAGGGLLMASGFYANHRAHHQRRHEACRH